MTVKIGSKATSALQDNGESPSSRPSQVAIPILMYHHVAAAPPPGTPSRYMFVSPAMFRLQMRMLQMMGYRGCSMADLDPYLRGEATGKIAGITFDDGYRNVYRNALPVLDEFGFTATTYFVSGQVGGHNAWDADRMPSDPCMSVGELREWSLRGHEVGAHTVDHERLSVLPEDEARHQIADCRHALEDMSGVAVEAFSYPFGSYNERVVEIAREAGYRTAATTVKRRATMADDPLCLPRLTAKRTDWPLRFVWKHLM